VTKLGSDPGLEGFASMAALEEIEPGLWRWSAPHPGWRPDAAPESPADWPRAVGCVLCDAPDATVLIDPLLPLGDERFLGALDEHVGRRDRRVAVLTTIGFHRRSRDQLAARYGATTSRAKKNLPAGVESFPIRGAGETIFWLPKHRALVPGDRIIGAPNARLRLCPESWLRYLSSGITLAELAEALRPLLDLEIQRVLVSHGEPVLSDGRKKLAKALG
jgi:hypothetical protein